MNHYGSCILAASLQEVVVLPERDLCPKEVAAIVGVSPKTVRRWCRAGLFGYKGSASDRGEWRIPPAQLDRVRRVAERGEMAGAA